MNLDLRIVIEARRRVEAFLESGGVPL